MKINFKVICISSMLFGLFISLSLLTSSCGNKNSASNTVNSVDSTSKTVKQDVTTEDQPEEMTSNAIDEMSAAKLNATDGSGLSSVTSSMKNAKNDGKSVFLVVTGTGDTDLNKALALAGKANKSASKSVIVKMDRDDKSNAALVKEYGVESAPLPIILVISPSGVLSGGYMLKEATVDLLVKLIPTPKQDAVLQALNNKKSVFVVASKKAFSDKSKVVENCKAAVTQMGTNAVLVEVDLADSKEKSFLELLKINTAATSTATVILNSKGQINGTFYELKDVATLVTLAKKVASSCCPSGSGKGCGN